MFRKKKNKTIPKEIEILMRAMAPKIYIETKCSSCKHHYEPKKKVE